MARGTVLVCAYDYHARVKVMKTARMTILVTPEQKASINKRAKQLKLSAGEVIRRAVDSYSSTIEDEAVLSALAHELEHSVKQARGALREALSEGKRLRKEWAARSNQKRRAA
jgi:hypothetical protein